MSRPSACRRQATEVLQAPRARQVGQTGQGQTGQGQTGQAAVELALVLPLLAIMLLVVIQVAVVVRDQVLVVHAAREAARAAAVDPSAGAARRAALAAAALDPHRLVVKVDVHGAGKPVDVSLWYRSTTVGPMIRGVVPGVRVQAHASMRREF